MPASFLSAAQKNYAGCEILHPAHTCGILGLQIIFQEHYSTSGNRGAILFLCTACGHVVSWGQFTHKNMWSRRSGNKYNVSAKERRTALGRVFDSQAEMFQAIEFENLLKAGELLELEYQPSLVLVPKPNLIKYVPDFRVVWRNGNEEYVDVKGVETPAFRLKAKLMRHFHPDKKLVITKSLYVEEERQEVTGKEGRQKGRRKAK